MHGHDHFDDLTPPRPRGGRHGGGRGGHRGCRALGHGDLRLLALALIAEQPRHGYELIRLISEQFQGLYAPSPGVVYPTLTQLETQGLIAADAEQARKCYRITGDGTAFVDAEREAIQAAQHRTRRSANAWVKEQLPAPVRDALRLVKRSLAAHHGHWDETEVERVATLLQQTAEQMEHRNG